MSEALLNIQGKTMTIRPFFCAAVLALGLAACGEAGDALKTTAGAVADSALGAVSQAVDTKTACMIAGQGEPFCGCLQDTLGAELDGERLRALADAVARTLGVGGLAAATGEESAADAETKNAMIQCAARAAAEGAIGEAGGAE